MRDIYDYYLTTEDCARAAEYGVSQSLLCERVRRLCWDKERAITTPPKPKRSIIPQIVRDLADQHNIPFALLSQRVHNGWDLLRAATTPKADKKDFKPPTRRDPFADMAEALGINRSTYHCRVRRARWDRFTAATTPPMSKSDIARMVNSRAVHPWAADNLLVFKQQKAE